MAASDPLRDSVAALSRFFVGDGTLGDTLQRVAELTATAVPPAVMTGITLIVEDRPTTAFFTDESAVEIDQAQYDTGSGPCLDAFREGHVNRIDCTTEDQQWPEFSRAAAEHGILSVLSLPLVAWGNGMGALNLYAREEAAFSADDEEAGLAFAEQAAIVLANAQAYWDAYTLSEDLNEALKSRATIEQAKGMLMARQGIDADAAFDVLKRASQRENRKLREIAGEIVARASGPPGPAGGGDGGS